jgi:hypothetical protein
LKEQCLWTRTYRNVDELRDAVAAFVELYNTQWLIERLGHRKPRETYQKWLADKAAAAELTRCALVWPESGRTPSSLIRSRAAGASPRAG